MTRILTILSLLAAAPALAAAGEALPDVACRYEMKVVDLEHQEGGKPAGKASWYFWRADGLVQTRDEDGDHGEIWERNGLGQIFYRKLFHADRTAVEYMPADHPSQRLDFGWTRVATMLGQEELERLKIQGTTTYLGRPAEIRAGSFGGQQIELVWLTVERLPARLKKSDARRSAEMTLVELSPLDQAKAKPVSTQEIEAYRQIDQADFGDMETDPFVRRVDQHVH